MDEISEAMVTNHLTTKGISNFLLWQLSYAEFYFTEVFWPEFREEAFYEAILYYQRRERRFGKTSEQLI